MPFLQEKILSCTHSSNYFRPFELPSVSLSWGSLSPSTSIPKFSLASPLTQSPSQKTPSQRSKVRLERTIGESQFLFLPLLFHLDITKYHSPSYVMFMFQNQYYIGQKYELVPLIFKCSSNNISVLPFKIKH